MSLENPEGREQARVLPLWPTLRTACQFPWQHRRHVGRLLIIPVPLSIVLAVLSVYWVQSQPAWGTVLGYAFSLFHFLIFTFFAVSYHRSILIGENAVSWFGVPGWTMRETRFFVWFVTIYLVVFFFMFLVSVALSILTVTLGGIFGEAVVKHPAYLYITAPAVLIPMAYYIGRMSLVLPAVAIDLRPTFNSAMSLSEENGWRVALLVGGTPFIFWGLSTLILWSLGYVSVRTGTETIYKVDIRMATINGLQQLFYYVWLTIEVAILSFTYRFLSQTAESTTSPQELA